MKLSRDWHIDVYTPTTLYYMKAVCTDWRAHLRLKAWHRVVRLFARLQIGTPRDVVCNGSWVTDFQQRAIGVVTSVTFDLIAQTSNVRSYSTKRITRDLHSASIKSVILVMVLQERQPWVRNLTMQATMPVVFPVYFFHFHAKELYEKCKQYKNNKITSTQP